MKLWKFISILYLMVGVLHANPTEEIRLKIERTQFKVKKRTDAVLNLHEKQKKIKKVSRVEQEELKKRINKKRRKKAYRR